MSVTPNLCCDETKTEGHNLRDSLIWSLDWVSLVPLIWSQVVSSRTSQGYQTLIFWSVEDQHLPFSGSFSSAIFLGIVVSISACHVRDWGSIPRQGGNTPLGFLHSLVDKASVCNAGDLSSIPGLGRYPGEGKGNPPQYSCWENCMEKGAWQAMVLGIGRVKQDLLLSFFL